MSDSCGCELPDEFAMVALDEETDEPDLLPDPRGDKVRIWRSIQPIAPYGVPTGDGRRFAAGSLTSRELPLPVKWQRTDADGHRQSVTVATMEGVDFREDGVYAWGVVLDPDRERLPRLAEDVAEATLLLESGVLGPSVDLDDMEYHPYGNVAEHAANGKPTDIEVTRGRISAVTLVAIPAFAEARAFTLEEMDAEEFAGLTTTITASGVFRHPEDITVARDRAWDPLEWLSEDPAPGLALYSGAAGDLFPVASMVHGEMALVPGAVADAISVLAFQEDRVGLPGGVKMALRERLEELAARCELPAPPWVRESLLASVATARATYDAALFEDPKLDRPTPITIQDGRVFGHLATWGTCHVGFPGTCVRPPKSKSKYSYFHVAEALTNQGPVAVGKITLGGGHADSRLGLQAALSHYDDADAAVALVRAGEDRHGIWVSGAAIPGAEDRFARLPMFPLSGDWRRAGGVLEMVAALAVNTPGFPVPRVYQDHGRDLSLVAAGALAVEPMTLSVAEQVRAEISAQRDRDRRGRQFATTIGSEIQHLDGLRRTETARRLADTF